MRMRGLQGFKNEPSLLRKEVLKVLIDERVDRHYGGTDVELLDHEMEHCFSHQYLLILEGVIDELVEEDIVRSIAERFDTKQQNVLYTLQMLRP